MSLYRERCQQILCNQGVPYDNHIPDSITEAENIPNNVDETIPVVDKVVNETERTMEYSINEE